MTYSTVPLTSAPGLDHRLTDIGASHVLVQDDEGPVLGVIAESDLLLLLASALPGQGG